MALDVLSLPTDITWRRLASSRDMMVDRLSGNLFPLKRRSSIAIFYFEPDHDPEQHLAP